MLVKRLVELAWNSPTYNHISIFRTIFPRKNSSGEQLSQGNRISSDTGSKKVLSAVYKIYSV